MDFDNCRTWLELFLSATLNSFETLKKTQLWSLCHLLPNLAAGFLFDFKRVVMRPNLKPSHYEKSRGSFVQKARGRRCSQILQRQQSIFDLKYTPKDFLNILLFFGSTNKFDRKITITLKILSFWHFLGWL